METQTTLAEFIAKHSLTFSVKRETRNPHMANMGPGARHWLCYIGRLGMPEDDQMHVPFSQGSAHTKPPTLEDVLDCLASDATGVEDASSFEDWASEYGYNTNSRKAKKTYQICAYQARQLQDLLGEEAFKELLYSTERL